MKNLHTAGPILFWCSRHHALLLSTTTHAVPSTAPLSPHILSTGYQKVLQEAGSLQQQSVKQNTVKVRDLGMLGDLLGDALHSMHRSMASGREDMCWLKQIHASLTKSTQVSRNQAEYLCGCVCHQCQVPKPVLMCSACSQRCICKPCAQRGPPCCRHSKPWVCIAHAPSLCPCRVQTAMSVVSLLCWKILSQVTVVWVSYHPNIKVFWQPGLGDAMAMHCAPCALLVTMVQCSCTLIWIWQMKWFSVMFSSCWIGCLCRLMGVSVSTARSSTSGKSCCRTSTSSNVGNRHYKYDLHCMTVMGRDISNISHVLNNNVHETSRVGCISTNQ